MAQKTGSRRLARERAFRVLYGLAFAEEDSPPDAASALADQPDPDGEPRLNAKGAEFLRQLVLGAWSQRDELDETIARFSQNWKVNRMAWVDLAVLRLGMFELLCRPDVPPRVVINEAVELAKIYGDHNTPGFVNGILDAASRALERGELQARQVDIPEPELPAQPIQAAQSPQASDGTPAQKDSANADSAASDTESGPEREAAVKLLTQSLSRLELREHGAAHRVSMGVLAVLGDPLAKYYLQQEGFGVPERLTKAELASTLRLSEPAVAGQLGGGQNSLNAALKAAGAGVQLKLDRHGARLVDASGREWEL